MPMVQMLKPGETHVLRWSGQEHILRGRHRAFQKEVGQNEDCGPQQDGDRKGRAKGIKRVLRIEAKSGTRQKYGSSFKLVCSQEVAEQQWTEAWH